MGDTAQIRPPTHWSRRAPCQMRLSDFSPVQAAQVWTGRAVSDIRSTTTAHSLVKKSSLPDAALRLLASPSGTGVDGKGSLCYSLKDHRPLIGQEELLVRCGCPTSRMSAPNKPTRGSAADPKLLQAACQRLPSSAPVWTRRPVPAIRPTTTAHSLVRKSSLPDSAFRYLA